MLVLRFFVIVIVFATLAQAQDIDLSGTIYDPNGSVVVGAKVSAFRVKSRRRKKVAEVRTDSDGHYSAKLLPMVYRLEVTQPSFKIRIIPKYLLVNSAFGKVSLDVVIFGDNPEPCGYGGDCSGNSRRKKTKGQTRKNPLIIL